MANKTLDLSRGLARDWVPVTPNDGTDNMTSGSGDIVVGFYVTVGGAVAFITEGGTRTVTYLSGTIVPCSGVTRIKSTGTTATGIHALVV